MDVAHPASEDEASPSVMCRAWLAERLTRRRIDELLDLLRSAESEACHSPWPW